MKTTDASPAAPPRRKTPPWVRWAALLTVAVLEVQAVTLRQLEHDPRMAPKRFASFFEYFAFEFHEEVQPAEVFLAREKGDCDDYAVLADFVLKPKHYTTHLIWVRMVGQIPHCVCYVDQSKAYLDYNNRDVFFTLERSRPSLREIANKVAASFNASWTSATEFTYSYATEIHGWGATVVRTDPPKDDPALGQTKLSKIYVN